MKIIVLAVSGAGKSHFINKVERSYIDGDDLMIGLWPKEKDWFNDKHAVHRANLKWVEQINALRTGIILANLSFSYTKLLTEVDYVFVVRIPEDHLIQHYIKRASDKPCEQRSSSQFMLQMLTYQRQLVRWAEDNDFHVFNGFDPFHEVICNEDTRKSFEGKQLIQIKSEAEALIRIEDKQEFIVEIESTCHSLD